MRLKGFLCICVFLLLSLFTESPVFATALPVTLLIEGNATGSEKDLFSEFLLEHITVNNFFSPVVTLSPSNSTCTSRPAMPQGNITSFTISFCLRHENGIYYCTPGIFANDLEKIAYRGVHYDAKSMIHLSGKIPQILEELQSAYTNVQSSNRAGTTASTSFEEQEQNRKADSAETASSEDYDSHDTTDATGVNGDYQGTSSTGTTMRDLINELENAPIGNTLIGRSNTVTTGLKATAEALSDYGYKAVPSLIKILKNNTSDIAAAFAAYTLSRIGRDAYPAFPSLVIRWIRITDNDASTFSDVPSEVLITSDNNRLYSYNISSFALEKIFPGNETAFTTLDSAVFFWESEDSHIVDSLKQARRYGCTTYTKGASKCLGIVTGNSSKADYSQFYDTTEIPTETYDRKDPPPIHTSSPVRKKTKTYRRSMVLTSGRFTSFSLMSVGLDMAFNRNEKTTSPFSYEAMNFDLTAFKIASGWRGFLVGTSVWEWRLRPNRRPVVLWFPLHITIPTFIYPVDRSGDTESLEGLLVSAVYAWRERWSAEMEYVFSQHRFLPFSVYIAYESYNESRIAFGLRISRFLIGNDD